MIWNTLVSSSRLMESRFFRLIQAPLMLDPTKWCWVQSVEKTDDWLLTGTVFEQNTEYSAWWLTFDGDSPESSRSCLGCCTGWFSHWCQTLSRACWVCASRSCLWSGCTCPQNSCELSVKENFRNLTWGPSWMPKLDCPQSHRARMIDIKNERPRG